LRKVTARTRCKSLHDALALLLINALTPWLQKLGFGRLPGDIRFKIFGREIFIPLASTIILSLVCAGISKVL
jgi:Protein of unknown function (DUF2905)